ncbi:MAG: hypothetical protein GAK31_03253 [Stenotrophomonas maltophilia]|uniref:Transmembrane protein n=1 Tax=Stenotrophomonas maltophilia TaxID=40324 RepID=A0A7V8FF62_STEMA|nr:MAG: hypothetical protein GAK31_03253 [Stenotrophomonas maltophilia]
MTPRISARTAALLLAAATALAPTAHAGEMNSSEASVLITSVIVISMPLAMSARMFEYSTTGSQGKNTPATPQRTKAAELPPMEVKAVEDRQEGGRQVQLQVHGHADQTATLKWPAVAGHDPVAVFAVGQTVHFSPTPAGSGWTVRDTADKPLAYVPTAYAANDNTTGTW